MSKVDLEKEILLDDPIVQQKYPPGDPEHLNPRAANYVQYQEDNPQDNPPAYEGAQVGYQPPILPEQLQNPNIYTEYKPQLQPTWNNNNESDKYLMIGAILGIASLVLTGFMSLICTVPLLICAISTLQSKDKNKRLHCSKLSICGGVYAIFGGCIFLILFVVIYASAIALNSSGTSSYPNYDY